MSHALKLINSLPTYFPGSLNPKVAENLMVMHEECLDGHFRSIEVLRDANLKQAARPQVTQIVNDDEDDEDQNVIGDDNSSNMNVDIPESESNVNSGNRPVNGPLLIVSSDADDGWIAVTNRRSKCRKN